MFGPVLVVIPNTDEGEEVHIANCALCGLTGAVWSADIDRAITFARRIRTGQLEIIGGSDNSRAPCCGYKNSGFDGAACVRIRDRTGRTTSGSSRTSLRPHARPWVTRSPETRGETGGTATRSGRIFRAGIGSLCTSTTPAHRPRPADLNNLTAPVRQRGRIMKIVRDQDR